MATAVNTVVGDNILPLPVLTERYYTAGGGVSGLVSAPTRWAASPTNMA